jgi:hypothetical protein
MIVSTFWAWSSAHIGCRTEMEPFRSNKVHHAGERRGLIAKPVDFTYTGNDPRRISKVKRNFMAGVPLGT